MVDKKQLRTLLLKIAVRKFQEQERGKTAPNNEITHKVEYEKPLNSKSEVK